MSEIKEDKDTMLQELINELAHDFQLDEDKFKIYVKKFSDIYSDGYRHEYSSLTRVLFLLEKDEERDYLPEKIKNIKEKMEKGEAQKSIGKLWDHINLENIRLVELRKISKNAQDALNAFEKKVVTINDEATKVQDNIKNDVEKIYDKMDKVDKKMESTQISYVSILGIFSSITFALFGGLNILSQVFSKITNLNDHSSFAGIMTVGGFIVFSIFNLLNMLLYSIGRIVEKDLISRNCKETCISEKCTCKWYKKIFIKYTHITVSNISIIIFTSIFLIVYLKI